MHACTHMYTRDSFLPHLDLRARLLTENHYSQHHRLSRCRDHGSIRRRLPHPRGGRDQYEPDIVRHNVNTAHLRHPEMGDLLCHCHHGSYRDTAHSASLGAVCTPDQEFCRLLPRDMYQQVNNCEFRGISRRYEQWKQSSQQSSASWMSRANNEHAVWGALMDFTLAVLPWKILWGLQMRPIEKIGIAVAMSLGFLSVRMHLGRIAPVRHADHISQCRNHGDGTEPVRHRARSARHVL